jgi:pimeloyl-ACP methyl ester carboxylesterase
VFEVAPHNVWPRLHQLAAPAIFVQGQSSDSFTRRAVERLGRELPSARILVIPGSGHFVPMERPVELGRAILEELAEV